MRILILMYHMIAKTNDEMEKRYALAPKRFRGQLRYLKRRGFTPIGLNDIYNCFVQKGVRLPTKPVIITFDDGYMDNYENALLILKEQNVPATLFIVSGFINKTNRWIISEGYPEKLLMGWNEIREMQSNGVTIGSHTVNHNRLTALSLKDAKSEIEDSKKFIEDSLGTQINHFAYPYGEMNDSVVNMTKEAGYRTACSARSGFNSEQVSLFELRRIEIYGTDTLLQFSIKLTYGTNDGNLLLPVKYYMKRLSERFLTR